MVKSTEKTIDESVVSDDFTEATRLMNGIQEFCLKKRIPMFVTVANVKTETDVDYIVRTVTPLVAKVNIKDDKISKFNAAINGNFYLKVTEPTTSDVAEIFDEF